MLTKSKQFAKNIKTLLKEQGLNLNQAAQQWGFKKENEAALLRSWATRGIDHASDKSKPLLKKLAKAFHRNIEDLWKPYPDVSPVAKIMEKLKRDLVKLTTKQTEEIKKEVERLFNLIEPGNVFDDLPIDPNYKKGEPAKPLTRYQEVVLKMDLPQPRKTGRAEDDSELYFRTIGDVENDDERSA